jgi:hypothetical protein
MSDTYIAKIGNSYVSNFYESICEASLVKDKYKARIISREEAEWLKTIFQARIIQVEYSLKEVGLL